MAKPLALPVWDRRTGKLFREWMDDHQATYESQPRRSITQWIKSQPLYDWLDAAYRNTRWSAREIEPFIRKYNIDMSEFEPVKYRSFAEFFDRRFRPGARKFPLAAEEMGAFAEARYFGWNRLTAEQHFPVKGHSLSAEHILGSNERNVNILETRHFGRLAFVEIGALSVGRIIQTHPLDEPFHRGQEKS